MSVASSIMLQFIAIVVTLSSHSFLWLATMGINLMPYTFLVVIGFWLASVCLWMMWMEVRQWDRFIVLENVSD
jgi:hypothetical protein